MKVGEVVTLDQTVAFVKRSPESVTNVMLKKYTNVTMEEYEQWFTSNDFNLPQGKRNSIIAKSHVSAEIKDFLDLELIHGRLANGDPQPLKLQFFHL